MNRKRVFHSGNFCFIFFMLNVLCFFRSQDSFAQIEMKVTGSYSQDFNTLSSTGNTNPLVLPEHLLLIILMMGLQLIMEKDVMGLLVILTGPLEVFVVLFISHIPMGLSFIIRRHKPSPT